MPYVDDDGNPVGDTPAPPASRGSGYVYEPRAGVVIESPTALTSEQQREAMETGFVRDVPEASVVGPNTEQPPPRTPAPPVRGAPPERELPFGEYMGDIASGFAKTAGRTAATVFDTSARLQGMGNPREALVKFLAEKLGGGEPVEDPAGTMQPFENRTTSERIGGVGARVAMGAGGAGAITAALPATVGTLTMAGAQGAGAGAEALAAGDDPKVAALFGAGGTLLGGAFQAAKNFRRGRADTALQAEIDALMSRPTPTQAISETIGVKPKHLGKNPDTRYRPAEAVEEHGIDTAQDVGGIRRTAQSRLDDLDTAKQGMLRDPRMVSTRDEAWRMAQNELQPLIDRTARRGTTRLAKRLQGHYDELNEMFNGRPAVGSRPAQPPRFSQGMGPKDYQDVVDGLDQMISEVGTGRSAATLRQGLQSLRRNYSEALLAGDDELRAVNASKRDLGATVKAAKEQEIAEAASHGPTPVAPTVPEGLSPEQQAMVRLAASSAAKTSGITKIGGPFVGYALLRYIESKLREVP